MGIDSRCIQYPGTEACPEIKSHYPIISFLTDSPSIRLLRGYAQEFEMNVLMANYGGKSWDMESGGRSGFWNQKGELIMEMGGNDSGLLIVEKQNDVWQGKLLIDPQNRKLFL